MKGNKELAIDVMTVHCEAIIREAPDTIFHDGIMHKERLEYAISPSLSGLAFAALLRYLGYGPDRELTPEDDEVTKFYCNLNEWLVEWSACPAINTELYGAMAVWDTARLTRINKTGFRYIDIPLAMLVLQYELTGEITIVDDTPEYKVGAEVMEEVYSRLNAIFQPEYELAVAAKESAHVSDEVNASPLVSHDPENPTKVEQLLVAPVAETQQDEFDINALGNLDLDGAASRVEEMRDGGGEVLPPSDDCEGGACKI